jgi:two-component system sensor histidine kinase YesM
MGAIPLALLGVVIGVMSFIKADKVVKESEKRVLSDTINRIDININVKARQIDSFMNTVAESAQVKALISWQESGAAGGFNTDELRMFLTNTWGSFSEITGVSILLGSDVIYTSREQAGEQDAMQLAELYAGATAFGDRVNWSNVTNGLYDTDDEDRQILIYKGIRNAADDTIGLIVLEVNPRTFGSAILTKQKILGYQTTFITDKSGGVIYSDNSVRDDDRLDILERYDAGERKFILPLGDTRYYVCSQYNGLTGWVTYTMIPESKLFPEADSLRNYIAALVSVSVILAAVCLLVLSLAITKPLARLTTGMKEAQDKNFELRLENDRADEIGELTDSFNFMVNRIHILVNQVYQEKLAQKTAEIEALQAQINPHFLYNTLDSINWMLIEKNEMDVSAIVVALGKLMQYSMDTSTPMVALKEEYRYARDYLLIQQYRLEDRLEFTLELEPRLEDFPVPKLILQPLIENAIDHGISNCENGGEVCVKAFRTGQFVCIQVQDNGRGMTPDELYQYPRLLKNDTTGYKNIGVRNVARRLQLHFNDRCEFIVENKLNVGVSITVIIPAEAREPESREQEASVMKGGNSET